MRVLSFSVVLSLVHFSALVSAHAIPPTPFSLSSRSESSPSTLTDSHTLPILIPRDPPNTRTYYAPNTATYIILTLAHTFEGTAIQNLLTLAMHTINLHLGLHGDGLLEGGTFDLASSTTGLVLRAWNANNHQTTWGVLESAVTAMLEGMGRDGWGWGTFAIYDGGRQVGSGIIETPGK